MEIRWCPKEIFITPAARLSNQRVCLYKDIDNYITVDYFEVNDYLDQGYYEKPMQSYEENKNLINKNLKVEIDRLKQKIKLKQQEKEIEGNEK
jgi:hypothetical protein